VSDKLKAKHNHSQAGEGGRNLGRNELSVRTRRQDRGQGRLGPRPRTVLQKDQRMDLGDGRLGEAGARKGKKFHGSSMRGGRGRELFRKKTDDVGMYKDKGSVWVKVSWQKH